MWGGALSTKKSCNQPGGVIIDFGGSAPPIVRGALKILAPAAPFCQKLRHFDQKYVILGSAPLTMGGALQPTWGGHYRPKKSATKTCFFGDNAPLTMGGAFWK